MPEGPSIVILREQASGLACRTIVRVEGNSGIDKERLVGQRVLAVRSWGKHFLIELQGFSLRVHLLMFGTYRLNERKDTVPRLALRFDDGQELNFYTCSVRYVEGPLDAAYDWRTDIMSEQWDATLARRRLRAMPEALACDALLDQGVFAGAGNIIKNEVLFRVRVHPLSLIGGLPVAKLRELVMQVRQYGFEFLAWKKAFVLKQHWQVHTRRTCPRCAIPLKLARLGETQRRSFFCERCQKRYAVFPQR